MVAVGPRWFDSATCSSPRSEALASPASLARPLGPLFQWRPGLPAGPAPTSSGSAARSKAGPARRLPWKPARPVWRRGGPGRLCRRGAAAAACQCRRFLLGRARGEEVEPGAAALSHCPAGSPASHAEPQAQVGLRRRVVSDAPLLADAASAPFAVWPCAQRPGIAPGWAAVRRRAPSSKRQRCSKEPRRRQRLFRRLNCCALAPYSQTCAFPGVAPVQPAAVL